jgi:putative transposase
LNRRNGMREPYTQLYLHLTWATWDRAPILTPERQPLAYASIQRTCAELRTSVIAIGGIDDHVHVLLRFPPTVAISHLVQRMKGASSRLVEQVSREAFRWQGGYGAFTVSRRGVPVVRDYVLNQAEHHQRGSLIHALEVTSAPQPSTQPALER